MDQVTYKTASIDVGPASICTSAASYWMPKWSRRESAWLEHAPFGFWLIDALRPRSVVELGTYSGFSFAVFCQAVQALNVDCACYGVDHWLGDEHGGFYGEEVYRAINEHTATHYSSFAQLIRSDFNAALEHFEDGSIDLLHIDGCHSYEAVRSDFMAWRSRLSGSGVIMLHDTNVHERGFGVSRLWQELSQQYKHFEFLHGHGLGILGVGNTFPERIEFLFGCSGNPDAVAEIRACYGRLGMALSDRLERQNSTDQARLAQLELEVGRQARRQAYLTAVVAQREAELAQRISDLGWRDGQIAQCEANLAAHVTELEKCRTELERLNRYLAPFRNSVLWPLTSPLRSAARRLLPRGR
jgi:hypothetical protein